MVRVGRCVPEWEEERSSSRVLGREARGEARSWCGWCWRVVPGNNDVKPGGKPAVRAMPVRPAAQVSSRPALPQMVASVRS